VRVRDIVPWPSMSQKRRHSPAGSVALTSTVCAGSTVATIARPGDLVIIISYAEYDDDELDEAFAPRIVFVDGENRRVVPASRTEFEEGRHEA